MTTFRSWCKVGGGLALACGLMAFGVPPTAKPGSPDVSVKSAADPAPKPAGPSPFTDYRSERPGKRVKITPADLPAPRVTKSVDNPPHMIKRPKDAWPQAPAGFKVDLYADHLSKPRLIRVAPNGD